MRTTETFGGLDILVWAVQSALERPADKTTDAEWSRGLAVNLSGAFFACRAALREVLGAGGGMIILVAGPLAERAEPDAAMLATAQHGLVGLARALATEYADRAIRATVIVAGAQATDAADDATGEVPELGPLAVRLTVDEGADASGQVLHARR